MSLHFEGTRRMPKTGITVDTIQQGLCSASVIKDEGDAVWVLQINKIRTSDNLNTGVLKAFQRQETVVGRNCTRLKIYRWQFGAATAVKPNPRKLGQKFGTLAGPAPSRAMIGRKSGLNSQSRPNIGRMPNAKDASRMYSYSASSRNQVTSQYSLLSAVIDAKLESFSKALTDANTKNAATWTKVDKELSSLNEYLALSTPDPLAAKKVIQLSDAAIKTATASLVDRRKILERAISLQKTNSTIRRLSENRPLDARKLGHSNSREEVRKRLSDGASSADPKLNAKPIVVIAPCAPEGTPRQTTAAPDSNLYSTTADFSNSKGSDALEEASLTWTERP
ncbi:hypothetical protein CLF_110187, partial [Clonorchis sinensis]